VDITCCESGPAADFDAVAPKNARKLKVVDTEIDVQMMAGNFCSTNGRSACPQILARLFAGSSDVAGVDRKHNIYNYLRMKSIMQSILLLLALALSTSAQFQFFEQFFGNEQHQHQQPQNVPSDSSWYKENYAKGKRSDCSIRILEADCFSSTLLELLMS
jgi:hypothetical protein